MEQPAKVREVKLPRPLVWWLEQVRRYPNATNWQRLWLACQNETLPSVLR